MFAVAVVLVMGGLLAWVVVRSEQHADKVVRSNTKLTTATEDLGDVLGRRAPTLEYLACRDRIEFAFEAAQADLLDVLIDRASVPEAERAQYDPAIALAREQYDLAKARLKAAADPKAPPVDPADEQKPGRCPALPLP